MIDMKEWYGFLQLLQVRFLVRWKLSHFGMIATLNDVKALVI